MEMSRRAALKLGAVGGATALFPFGRAALGLIAPPVVPPRFSGSSSLAGGFTVPAGQVWAFDPNVSTTVVVRANVIVQGTLVMRPARPDVVHTLRFEGIDESKFIGGMVTAPVASDVGLWITGAGILDAQGTKKAGWNRAGDDPTWTASDELVVAPNQQGDLTGFKPFTKGGTVPSQTGPNGVVYRTEVANLTRNVRIEGTPAGRAHIMFLACKRPQTLKYVAIRYMGPQQQTDDTYRTGGRDLPVYDGVFSRYGLHFHMCGLGTVGSLIEGVVVRNTGGRAFVPHASHGMTFRDCVAYDVRTDGFWWDPGTETNDVLLDRCAVFGLPNNPGDSGLGLSGFLHGLGLRNVARGCVVAGVLNRNINSGGYHWPSSANRGNNVWTWDDNVAHNNMDGGIGVWQNDAEPHVVSRYVGYHNGTGIHHGAYLNTYEYRDCVTFRNGTELVQHALGAALYERSTFDGDMLITRHVLPSQMTTRYLNCRITGMVKVAESREAGIIRFESTLGSCDLRSDRFSRQQVLSNITVRNSDGSTFTVR